MSNERTGCSCSVPSAGLVVFIVFLILKLNHTIDWSWWWVTCPLWIGAVISIGFLILTGGFLALFAAAMALIAKKAERDYWNGK